MSLSSATEVDKEQDLISKLRQMFQQARDHKRGRYDQWMRNYKLVNNKMGSQTASNWAPSPRDSEIYPTLSALVAWMTDQSTIIDCTPYSDPGSLYYTFISGLANDLSAVLYSTWQVEDFEAQIKLVLWDAFIYGIGIFKNVWDNSLDDGYGNAMLKRVDPWSFYPDPDATSMEDAEYFVEARRMSYDELERRFPDKSAVLEASNSSGLDQIDERPTIFNDQSKKPKANPGALPSGQGRWSTPRTGPRTEVFPNQTVVVYEYWVRENRDWLDDDEGVTKDKAEKDRDNPKDPPQLAERHVEDAWRVIVLANGVILMDEWADELWSHKQHPYERYVFDDTGEFYGIALVDHLAYPQIYINRLLTALQYNAELTGNPIFIDSANSGLSRVGIINKPGQRLTVTGAAAMQNKPDWLTPPSMPQQVMDLVTFWISRLENTSGLSAIVRGATPNSRNSEGVMSSIQEAAFVRIRSALRNLEKTLERSAIKVADLIIDNFTEPRFLAIVGQTGELSTMALHARHFYSPSDGGATPLKFVIQIRAGASMPTSRQARMAEADQLFALQAIDDQALLEAHQYPHIPEILERKYNKIQAGLMGGTGARQRAGRKS